MDIKNNISGEETKDISDKLQSVLSRRSIVSYSTQLLVFAERYIKNNLGILETHQMYGRLELPITLNYKAAGEKGVIHIPMANKELYYRKGNGKWELTLKDLEIPLDAQVVDVEETARQEDYRNSSRIEAQKDEKVFKLYFGDSAFARRDRTLG